MPTVTATPTVTVTATPEPEPCGNGVVDEGEDCDPSATGSTCLQETCPSDCLCPCPSRIDFEPNASDPATELDPGQTGIAHDARIVSEGRLTVEVTGCDFNTGSRPCGICEFTGPVRNEAGAIQSQRCLNDSSIECSDAQPCPSGPCVFFFGAPLPLSAGGVATCVTNEIIGLVTGSANIETGESESDVRLTSRVFNGILLAQPCPQCTDTGPLNDGVDGGVCNGGTRNGLACDANAESPIPAFGRTSLDCPPLAGAQIASLPINLGASTGVESRSLSAASPNCTAFGTTSQKCPCDTCNNAAATPCSSNADCTAVGATICGGLRCLNDSADAVGTPCQTEGENNDAACGVVTAGFCDLSLETPVCSGGTNAGNPCVDDPGCAGASCSGGMCISGPTTGAACTTDAGCGGTCGRAGEATRPNTCSDGSCVTGGGTADGRCNAAPTDSICAIETFRGCTAASDCPAAGDSCSTKRRECFFNLDDLPVTNTGTISVPGAADPPVNDVSQPTFAALFCIGPTGASAVNNVAGLPGLGKIRLRGLARGLPAAAP